MGKYDPEHEAIVDQIIEDWKCLGRDGALEAMKRMCAIERQRSIAAGRYLGLSTALVLLVPETDGKHVLGMDARDAAIWYEGAKAGVGYYRAHIRAEMASANALNEFKANTRTGGG